MRSTLDNTSVQYGLSALLAEDQAGIREPDHTGVPDAARSAADPKALAAAYPSRLLNSLGLHRTPIIDQRTNLDLAGFGATST